MSGPAVPAGLAAHERLALLRLARAAVEDAVLGTHGVPALLARVERTAALGLCRGLFVTLKDRAGGPGALRGCIGTLDPAGDVVETVVEIAPRAALADPRFPPLRAADLATVRITISVIEGVKSWPETSEGVEATAVNRTGPEVSGQDLTPSVATPSAAHPSIRVGVDGVILEKGGAHALFLPQVAAEQGWTAVELLEHLACKAGLPPDGWRDAALSTFEAEVFGEP